MPLVLSVPEGNGVTLTLPNGETVHILCIGHNGKRHRIGITAPKSVKVLRDDARTNDERGKGAA